MNKQRYASDEIRSSMTSDQLRAALALLHWTQRGLAAQLGYDEATVRRWTSGAYPVPGDITIWLHTLAAFHAANPAPRR